MHCQLEHGGMQAEFSMKVSGRFSSCLVRQVNEAVSYNMVSTTYQLMAIVILIALAMKVKQCTIG